MTTHLEYVTGPLGERTALACACGRVADHQRLGSTALAAASVGLPTGAGHAAGHAAAHTTVYRRRAAALRSLTARSSRARHAA
ncbi:hypothetical protein [Agromyces aureus]|uniref:Uncharacterized protein n=1 Tax=Agromyces aureus TaxID=453304 RepID=A0A191WD48_9MICO|nr:hypothetical protein [Agromyces aureus]ANJ26128.1 hypothetical protein ATC03_04655 [Agromyces aureus]